MTQPYRLLVIDNSSHVRQASKLFLQSQGYQVFTAGDPVEARRLLSEQRVHLAIVDIRLEDDDDPQDTSGLDLAASLDPVVARIVITGYDSSENMRRALRPILPDNIPAGDYILKKDGPFALLEAIERVCRAEIDINWTLELEWKDISAETVGVEVELDQAALTREVLADEVDELLRRLFYKADQIVVSPLLSPARAHASSQSGAVVLKVQPHYRERGWGVPRVCKVSERRQIQDETHNYERHVKDFVGGDRRTNLERVKYTHYLGGILYAMLGAKLEETRDFHDLYRHAPVTEIHQVLTDLFEDVCKYWYDSQDPQDEINLTQLYRETLGLTDEKLQNMLTHHFPSQQEPTIQFEGLSGAFTNPMHWIRDLKSSTCRCVTHGDLHSHNILVNEYQQVWLIDFGRTGKGHVWRDFIELETDIKFTLLETVDLTTLYHFEMALLESDRLDDLPTLPKQVVTDPDMRKAFQVVNILRRMAVKVVKYDSDALSYYQGLFYQTLNAARLRKINAKKKQHALLSAALICERVDSWKDIIIRASD
jgi:DNA-binding NarL/FixJ family response regulator